jgi:hypothetical protein
VDRRALRRHQHLGAAVRRGGHHRSTVSTELQVCFGYPGAIPMRRSSGLTFIALVLAMAVSFAARAQSGEAAPSPPPPANEAAPPAPPTADDAGGQAAPQPWAPPSPPPAYPAPSPPQSQTPYPPAYPAPYAMPAPYPMPMPYGYPPWAAYEEMRKSAGLAFLIELVLPGVGSIYADHMTGALITWGLTLGGLLLLINGSQTTYNPATGAEETRFDSEMTIGVLMLLAGRTYGLVDSIVATRAYNARLRQRLGLAAALRLDALPTANGSHVLAPALRLTF